MSTPIPPAPPAAPKRTLVHRAWRVTKRLVAFSLLAIVGTAALYMWAAYSFSYSTGERAGFVQKFSKKGWVCKTWEGQMAMANLPGVLPEHFDFSLRDDALAAEINKSLGARVTLTYEQHLGLPSCFGETSYWITAVRPIDPPR